MDTIAESSSEVENFFKIKVFVLTAMNDLRDDRRIKQELNEFGGRS